jgi:D-glycero-D-manno-heptose 1,7-bisphosphate phosphatase
MLRELSRFGIEDVLLLAGFRSETVEQFCHDIVPLLPRPMTIRISVEPEPAGTGGALWYARHLLEDTFLLLNGDSWFDTNLARFFEAYDSGEIGGTASILLRSMEDCSRYGTVVLEGARLIAFREKAVVRAPGLINSGIYILDKSILDSVTPNCSIERDVLPQLAAKAQVSGKALDGYFIDIGIPEDYARAQHELPARLLRPAVFFDRDGVLNEDLGWVGSKDRFNWIAGAKEALRFVADSGLHAFVVTNQAGIAKGFYGEQDVELLHRHVSSEARAAGGIIDDIRYCPYHPDGTTQEYRRKSSWRKPGPGMILDLLKRWEVKMGGSLLIGDKPSDIMAAEAAGVVGFLYEGGDLLAFVKNAMSSVSSEVSG